MHQLIHQSRKFNFLIHLPSRFIGLLILLIPLIGINAQEQPNILLVIADDLGVDFSNGYHQGSLMPTTPTLDSLRSVGITFENVFANPKCTPSRATIMSGKYGIKTGVTGVPGNLDLEHSSVFTELANQTNQAYANAVIGKWHISQPSDPAHPINHGADYYMGVLGSSVTDYYAWDKTENGLTSIDSSYVTTSFTNAAIDWINNQNKPWLMWFAHVAPHSPLHVPPSHMYSINATGTNKRKYIAMIESVDYELNRLLYAIPEEVRENTIIIYVGDNGTPNNHLQDYPAGRGKGSLYQGGIRVPMIIAGAGVTRQGVRESALIHINDIYATILELAGAELPGGVNNSLSFSHLLSDEPGPVRDYNYSEFTELNTDTWAIRNQQYKLIEYIDGSQEMYDLLIDSFEVNDLLIGNLTTEQTAIKLDLEAEALQIRTAWSCKDHIQNGDELDIDCGGTYCPSCTVGTAEIDQENSLSVFPNPSTEFIDIDSKGPAILEVRVFNLLGELLRSETQLNTSKTRLDIHTLDPQVLVVEVKLKTGIETVKLLKL